MYTKRITIALFLIFSSIHLFSQDEFINENISTHNQFLYKAFMPGIVFFNDGGTAKADLNYNLFSEEMQFIEDGHIKSIKNPEEIKYIKLPEVSYYMINSKFYEVIYKTDVILLMLRKLNWESVNKPTGAYGTSSENSAVSQIKVSGSHTETYTSREDVEDSKNISAEIYNQFFIYDGKKINVLTKKKYLKQYSHLKNELMKYIEEKKVSFANPDNLKDLMIFTKTLEEN
ncbi:MAG: hypothetical protein KAQ75_03680 [Bacteroidales bacterium]|nr:hypothetical protein [Bacteroidales bacterium]